MLLVPLKFMPPRARRRDQLLLRRERGCITDVEQHAHDVRPRILHILVEPQSAAHPV